jgi:hypothetical protein
VFYQPKIHTVGSITDFVHRDSLREVKKGIKRFNKKAAAHGIKASLTTLAGATAIGITNISYANHAYAKGPVEYVKGQAKEKIVEAFMPLVDMIQALSYPIALVMLTGGALMFMINQKDKGIGLIQNASIGYILVQLMPLLMNMLVGIGNTVT